MCSIIIILCKNRIFKITNVLVAPQLNCDSLLRNIYPQLFTHCDCSYSQWSEWKFVPNSIVDVATSQCSTGQAYSESRTRSAVGEGCISETETRVICKFLTPLSLI